MSHFNYTDNHTLYYALRQHDESAFDYVYDQLLGPFTHWVYTHNGSEMDAEDAFQKGLESFLINLENGRYQFQATTKVTSVIFDYSKKVWINEVKSARRTKNSNLTESIQPVDDADLQANLERAELVQTVRAALNQLKGDCKNLIEWFYIDELSLREIAEKLGLKENSTKAKRYDCTEKLKEFYLQLAKRQGS
ncbi:RNA polymerase sigma factor [Tellurirhabdus bombi]|uniref:RNA polymerase sigma factor n=1 Tax=Tellurirhabdus bombi TaxID=2907205 RepID=UPI001F3973C7|nr:sigma-70 family RNA polymerase sigma factor [Tellurirhabdus bombi]